LKKNGIALDLVALGDLSEKQRNILQAMNETIKSDKRCDLIFVEPQSNLSDIIFNTAIMGGDGGGAVPLMNEAEDPELLMALQLSLQEEEQRRAADNRNNPQVAQNEDEELEQRALQLSLEEKPGEKKDDKKEE
jgi:hypothetical protein